MEIFHGPHRDLKLLERSPDYSKFGPIGFCIHMRNQCGEQVKIKSQPVLAEKVPEGNIGSVNDGTGNSLKNKYRYTCHGCGLNFHVLRDCPKKITYNCSGDDGSGGSESKGSEKL